MLIYKNHWGDCFQLWLEFLYKKLALLSGDSKQWKVTGEDRHRLSSSDQ